MCPIPLILRANNLVKRVFTVISFIGTKKNGTKKNGTDKIGHQYKLRTITNSMSFWLTVVLFDNGVSNNY